MNKPRHMHAILLAAGSGSRMARATHTVPKQFIEVDGEPLYLRSVRTLAALPELRGIVLVVPECDIPRCQTELTHAGLSIPWIVVRGGNRRQDSVAAGLAALREWAPTAYAVLIHDAARPFASAQLASRVADALYSGAVAVIPGVPVVDTIKETTDNTVTRTLERASLRAIQTPQGFLLEPLQKAHATALEKGWDSTDDAMLLEQCGQIVTVVEGEASNIKITNPADLRLLFPSEKKLGPAYCTGFGYDVHRYGQGRSMKLGGVPIQGAPEVIAHSDGDVLLHALMDAILGCLGLGDIGMLFPDTDPALDGIESGILLAEVLARAEEHRVSITHVDCTIIAQIPKISPHREHIRKNLCRLLQLPLDAVSVKATTEEQLGFTGEKKGIKAVAVVSAMRF